MRVGTIADVCRGAAVNRQQFNRYLSGAAIPNATTLARVCKFLDISETQLFQTEPELPSKHNSAESEKTLRERNGGGGFAQTLDSLRLALSSETCARARTKRD